MAIRNFAPGGGQKLHDPGATHPTSVTAVLTSQDHPALAHTAVRRLRVIRHEFVERLATQPAKDFNEYQKRLGQIEGLDIAIKALEEVDAQLRA